MPLILVFIIHLGKEDIGTSIELGGLFVKREI